MKPVTVSVTVPHSREDVYGFLDVLGNHEPFTDHMLVDWRYSGPPSGVGARARMRLKKPGRADWMDLEVIDATREHRGDRRGGRAPTDSRHLPPRGATRGRNKDFVRVSLAAGAAD